MASLKLVFPHSYNIPSLDVLDECRMRIWPIVLAPQSSRQWLWYFSISRTLKEFTYLQPFSISPAMNSYLYLMYGWDLVERPFRLTNPSIPRSSWNIQSSLNPFLNIKHLKYSFVPTTSMPTLVNLYVLLHGFFIFYPIKYDYCNDFSFSANELSSEGVIELLPETYASASRVLNYVTMASLRFNTNSLDS